MKVHKSEYSERVDTWLNAHGVQWDIERTGEAQGFPGEKSENGKPLLWHDTYKATFKRTTAGGFGAELAVPLFHQSAAHSSRGVTGDCPSGRAESPSSYCILSVITKSDPGTFADFCGEFGYDEDSRKAMDIYLAVQAEWSQVRRFFSAEELDELQELAS